MPSRQSRWVSFYKRSALVSPLLYLFGTTLLLPGCALLLPTFSSVDSHVSIWMLIVATTLLTVAAVIDVYREVATAKQLRRDMSLFVPICMLLGGVFFLGGSLLYLPEWTSKEVLGHKNVNVGRVGTWVFRCGTTFYMCGSVTSIIRALSSSKMPLASNFLLSLHNPVMGILAYIVGSVLYFIGGVLSEAKLQGFAHTWLVGSFFFVLGATIFFTIATSSKEEGGYCEDGPPDHSFVPLANEEEQESNV